MAWNRDTILSASCRSNLNQQFKESKTDYSTCTSYIMADKGNEPEEKWVNPRIKHKTVSTLKFDES